MANPARELADVLESWRVDDGRPIRSARISAMGEDGSDLQLFQHVGGVVQLLRDYEDAVHEYEKRTGRDTTPYLGFVENLYRIIYAPDLNWRAREGSSQANVPADTLAMLRLAADALDYAGISVLGEADLERVCAALAELLHLVERLPESEARTFLVWQIQQAIAFANDLPRFGSNTVRASVQTVLSTVDQVLAEEELDEEQASGLRNAARDLGVTIVGGVMTTGVLNALPTAYEAVRGVLGG